VLAAQGSITTVTARRLQPAAAARLCADLDLLRIEHSTPANCDGGRTRAVTIYLP
jgi:hypothetical protein